MFRPRSGPVAGDVERLSGANEYGRDDTALAGDPAEYGRGHRRAVEQLAGPGAGAEPVEVDGHHELRAFPASLRQIARDQGAVAQLDERVGHPLTVCPVVACCRCRRCDGVLPRVGPAGGTRRSRRRQRAQRSDYDGGVDGGQQEPALHQSTLGRADREVAAPGSRPFLPLQLYTQQRVAGIRVDHRDQPLTATASITRERATSRAASTGATCNVCAT